MNRRQFLPVLPLLLSPSLAHAETPPWRGSVLNGGMRNGVWNLGLEIDLQPHWKTYWRVPGDGGVPPFIEVKGTNVKSARFDCPVPTRITTDAGQAIGYVETVVFPIHVEAVDATLPIEAEVSAFLGVCLEICIPAQFKASVSSTDAATEVDVQRLQKWQATVPLADQHFVSSASAILVDGKPALQLQLSQPVQDVFVEGSDLFYFKQPRMEGNVATLSVAGAKSIEDLRKGALRITAKLPFGGLEQMVAVV